MSDSAADQPPIQTPTPAPPDPAEAASAPVAAGSAPSPAGGKPSNKSRGRKGPEVVVLKTSRVMGPSGRSIARRTVVGCTPERGAALVARGWADPAPKGAVPVLTLTD